MTAPERKEGGPPAPSPEGLDACRRYGRAFYTAAAAGHAKIERECSDHVVFWHSMGRLAQAALKADSSTAAVAVLAATWGTAPRNVRDWALIARRYRNEDVVEFRRLRRPNGLPLEPSLFVYGKNVEDRATRSAMFFEAARTNMTARAFAEWVHEKNAALGRPEGGESAPALRAVLERYEDRLARLAALSDALREDVAAAIPRQGPSAAQMETALRYLDRMSAQARAIEEGIVAARRRLTGPAALPAPREEGEEGPPGG